MATVAADTSAIAPPLPLPSRSDAAPPAGPSGAFADLLDAQATPAPQAQGPGTAPPPPSTGAQDGANQGPPGSGAAPTGSLPPKASSSKDTANGKTEKGKGDARADTSGNGGSAVDPAAVAGLAIAALPPDPPVVAADQSPIASSDSQTGSLDLTAPANDDSASKSSDPGSANAPPNPVAAGLAAIVPGVQTIVAASAAPPSTGTLSAPVGPPAASAAAAIVITTASAAGPDSATAGAAQSPQADGTALANAPVAAPSQDLLIALGASPAIADAIGTPDQNPTSNLAVPFGVAPAVNAGNLSALAAVAPIGPLSPAPNTAMAVRGAEQASATESDPVSMALPAQIAAKFAASMRATDDGTSDLGPDTGLASAAGTSDTTKNTNDQPVAIQANFNPSVLTSVQTTPGAPATPQHAAVAADAVPLAGIPIAIAARVEAGEKHFEIRLDPPDLGRIEVTLNVDSSGHATSHLVVDRADTLDLLRRDAPALERALQSAGLTTDDSSLQFSLRNQSFAGQDQGTPAPLAPVSAPAPTDDVAPIDAAVRRYGAMAGLGSGVDIRV